MIIYHMPVLNSISLDQGKRMLFNYKSFRGIIRKIASYGYDFLRFDERNKSAKAFYLRHDVDISPLAALQISRIENSMCVKANFFFQIGAETYNIFSKDVISIMREVRLNGHCVGLHIDEALFKIEDVYPTLKWFSRSVEPIDFVVSFHRPTSSVLSKKYRLFVNAYQRDFFSRDSYLSDSKRSVRFYPELIDDLKRGKAPMQLLLHPCWWYPVKDVKDFKNILVKRKISELEKYLERNFRKVFKEAIKDESGSFGL